MAVRRTYMQPPKRKRRLHIPADLITNNDRTSFYLFDAFSATNIKKYKTRVKTDSTSVNKERNYHKKENKKRNKDNGKQKYVEPVKNKFFESEKWVLGDIFSPDTTFDSLLRNSRQPLADKNVSKERLHLKSFQAGFISDSPVRTCNRSSTPILFSPVFTPKVNTLRNNSQTTRKDSSYHTTLGFRNSNESVKFSESVKVSDSKNCKTRFQGTNRNIETDILDENLISPIVTRSASRDKSILSKNLSTVHSNSSKHKSMRNVMSPDMFSSTDTSLSYTSIPFCPQKDQNILVTPQQSEYEICDKQLSSGSEINPSLCMSDKLNVLDCSAVHNSSIWENQIGQCVNKKGSATVISGNSTSDEISNSSASDFKEFSSENIESISSFPKRNKTETKNMKAKYNKRNRLALTRSSNKHKISSFSATGKSEVPDFIDLNSNSTCKNGTEQHGLSISATVMKIKSDNEVNVNNLDEGSTVEDANSSLASNVTNSEKKECSIENTKNISCNKKRNKSLNTLLKTKHKQVSYTITRSRNKQKGKLSAEIMSPLFCRGAKKADVSAAKALFTKSPCERRQCREQNYVERCKENVTNEESNLSILTGNSIGEDSNICLAAPQTNLEFKGYCDESDVLEMISKTVSRNILDHMEDELVKGADISNFSTTSRRKSLCRRLSHTIIANSQLHGRNTLSILPNRSCKNSQFSVSVIEEETIIDSDKISTQEVAYTCNQGLNSARNLVLGRCNQTEPLSFETAFPPRYFDHCKKIGEGLYGEVFLWQSDVGASKVLKILPIEGDILVNGEKQKKFHEVLTELIISVELGNLRHETLFSTDCFVDVKRCLCVQGKYPAELTKLWFQFNDEKGSENDPPTIFDENQLFIVLELADGGKPLESYCFTSAAQAFSAFVQLALALATAENTLEFEHRDLHWGNVLISKTSAKNIVFNLNGKKIAIPSNGIQVTVIDFTLSRISYKRSCIFNDLSVDPELFISEGDYQFEIYRLMQKAVKNEWHNYQPYTNILWLHYILDKMLTKIKYKNVSTKIHKKYKNKMSQFCKDLLTYKSAYDLVHTGNILEMMK